MIANLENRRANSFRAALQGSGLPPAIEVSWEQVLEEPTSLDALRDCRCIRMDSFGENPHVLDALVELGGAPGRRLEHGELACQKEAHLGWVLLLRRLEESGVPPSAWLSRPADVATMFDKWQSHLVCHAARLSRPSSWLLPPNYEDFVASLPGRGRWFLKPLHGSSASGVCALRWSEERMQLTGPIELVRQDSTVTLFNSLRIRSYGRQADIAAILRKLLPGGMIGEEWLSKARLDGLEFDLRIVVIGGEARHVVVRQSHHPMTNLHLGNRRGDLSRFVAEFGDSALRECLDLAEATMACFPQTLYAGVDVLYGRDRRARVLEINAFGDLLPGVLHRGEDTATAIVRAAVRALS